MISLDSLYKNSDSYVDGSGETEAAKLVNIKAMGVLVGLS